MTFLQYVAVRLIGRPAYTTPDRWYWLCPFHSEQHPSFSTLPHKPPYRDRAQCFSCGWRGDAADLMAGCIMGENWPIRRARLEEWEAEWLASGQTAPDEVPDGWERSARVTDVQARKPDDTISFNSGRGRTTRTVAPTRQPGEAEYNAYEALLATFRKNAGGHPTDLVRLLGVAQRVLNVCAENGADPGGVAAWVGMEANRAQGRLAHMRECADPDCDYDCCRRARGWTEEDIKADIDERRRIAQDEREEWKREREEQVEQVRQGIRERLASMRNGRRG